MSGPPALCFAAMLSARLYDCVYVSVQLVATLDRFHELVVHQFPQFYLHSLGLTLFWLLCVVLSELLMCQVLHLCQNIIDICSRRTSQP